MVVLDQNLFEALACLDIRYAMRMVPVTRKKSYIRLFTHGHGSLTKYGL